MRVFEGKYIKVFTHNNKYFDLIVSYILEHFDKAEYNNYVILVSTAITQSTTSIRDSLPDSYIVYYNWEQLVGNNVYLDVEKYIKNLQGADEIWDYDDLNVEYLKWYKVKVDKVYNFGYTSSLENVINVDEPEIDVLFYGYMNDVRLKKFTKIYNSLYHDYSIVTIAGMDRIKQAEYIGNSKIILNIHGMEPYSRQEQDRIAYSLINSKCIVSEVSQINYFGDCIVEARLDDIPNAIKNLITYDNWRAIGSSANYKFKNGLQNIINNGS